MKELLEGQQRTAGGELCVALHSTWMGDWLVLARSVACNATL
jgi:hypothetical protein